MIVFFGIVKFDFDFDFGVNKLVGKFFGKSTETSFQRIGHAWRCKFYLRKDKIIGRHFE